LGFFLTFKAGYIHILNTKKLPYELKTP